MYLAFFSRAFVWGKPWVNRSAQSNSGAVSNRYVSVQIVSQQRHQLAKINRRPRDTKGINSYMSATDVTLRLTRYAAARKRAAALLTHAEWKLIGFIVATGIASVIFAAVRQQAIDWFDLLPDIEFALGLILIGVYLRARGNLTRTAMGMIAFSLSVSFLVCCGILTFTVLPFVNPMVDQQLLAADAALGFSWVDSINALADYPEFGIALRHIYNSILPQVAFVILVLSVLRQETELHRFLTVFF